MRFASTRQFMNHDSTLVLPNADIRTCGRTRRIIPKHVQKLTPSLNQSFQARKIDFELRLQGFIHERVASLLPSRDRISICSRKRIFQSSYFEFRSVVTPGVSDIGRSKIPQKVGHSAIDRANWTVLKSLPVNWFDERTSLAQF